MFGLGPTELGIALGVLLLLEVALFWAAASLADAPALSWVKTFAVALGVTLIWAAVNVAVGWTAGLAKDPFAPEHRLHTAMLAVMGLAVSWVVAAILYAPLLSVPLTRGMLISVFQVLLRAFLYVLIVAVIMVVLAVVQIWRAPA